MFKIYSFHVVGDSPLLMHNPRSMIRNSGGTTKRKTIPSPEEEAELGTYRDAEGFLVFPTIGFRGAFYRAMSGYKVGKKSLRSLLGHTRVRDEWTHILHPETKKKLKSYEIDHRRAVVQRQGIMRARPRIDNWAMVVDFMMNAEIATMTEEQLLVQATAILNEAGQTVGVGDFRLERGGWFGMFHVEKNEIK